MTDRPRTEPEVEPMVQTHPTDSDADGTAAAFASRKTVTRLSAAFMLDMDTYASAAAWGYDGLAFYYGGRGGVLGNVDAAEVTRAFSFFPEGSVRIGWEQALTVASPDVTAQRFADAAAQWAISHLPAAGFDVARLAELAGHVIDAADTADPATAVFQGWRQLPEPAEARSLVVHRFNALRELRFARHVRAVEDSGLAPVVAFMVSSPFMADVFGWPEPRPEPTEADREAMAEADHATDVAFGRDLAVLDRAQLAEFVELATAVGKAAT